jgi:hypothetical protein
MNAYELADKLQETEPYYSTDYKLFDLAATMLRQQQAEIDRLNYDLDGFKQNFFVSGFHLQIKMANEQLLKQQEQIDALKELLANEGIVVGHDYLNNCIATMRKAQGDGK